MKTRRSTHTSFNENTIMVVAHGPRNTETSSYYAETWSCNHPTSKAFIRVAFNGV